MSGYARRCMLHSTNIFAYVLNSFFFVPSFLPTHNYFFLLLIIQSIPVVPQTRGIYSYFFMTNNDEHREDTQTHGQPKEENEREEEEQQIQRTHNKEITVILLHLMKNSLFPIRSQIALGKVVVFSFRIS